ncbi:MAG: prephenate dehydratase [Gammaproteobacteria bacterium]
MNDKLQQLRTHIDAVDENIQSLISERAAWAIEVAQVKRAAGEAECYRPEREAEVFSKVATRNQGPLADEDMVRLFREIVSACRALEQPMKIAFLGPEGTFTQTAALKHFGRSVRTVPLATIDQIFHDVESGAVDYGVVPVENSTEGVVGHTLDSFINSPLKICGEIELRIHHLLLDASGDMKAVKRIYSHPQSLAQCRNWLANNFSGIECLSVSSNAEAARRAAQEPGTAAIAGNTAAEIYQLSILASNIEDEANNATRFLVIGRHVTQPSGNDKTSLLITTGNRPGALYRLLAPFERNGIGLTRIESRPSRQGTWDYVFFIDVDGHAHDQPMVEALRELEAQAALVKLLGSYPKAIV